MSQNKNEFLKYMEIEASSKDSGKPIHSHFDENKATHLSQILDNVYKPLEKTNEGRFFVLKASTKQATDSELINLKDILNQKLKDFNQTAPGFESRVWEIYSDLLDELIRQETIQSPERGLLWFKVKNEIQLSLKSLQKCYQSCFAYGMIKHIRYSNRIENIKSEIPKLENLARNINDSANTMLQDWKERREITEKQEQIKSIQRNFKEDQMTKVNKEITEQLAQRHDPEHRWLKDIASE